MANKLIIDKLIEQIKQKNNPTCVGLDTVLDYLPDNLKENCNNFEDVAKYILDFNKQIIDSIYDLIPCIKIQVACYEMYGTNGLNTFLKTIEYAKQKGLIVIADVKRNDIGNTAKYYSNAYLGKTVYNSFSDSAFNSDFATVNAYLGSDGIKPFIEDCENFGKGIFILVKTSNTASGEFQDKKFTDGRTLYETMGDYVQNWGENLIGKYGYSSVGAVVGATHKTQAENLRKRLKNVFFLIPGYGAQGGTAKDLAVCFDKNGIGGIVNSSRAILTAYKKDKYKGLDFTKAAREAVLDMKEDLNKYIKMI